MSRFHSYMNTAVRLLTDYKGEMPFAAFLKDYFSGNNKYGSQDRRQITHLCYVFFRLGKAIPQLATEERILTGLFLAGNEPNATLEALNPEWNRNISIPLDEKISSFSGSFSVLDIFPWQNELSDDMDFQAFCKSFLIQPNLFLRIRPGKHKKVEEQLQNSSIPVNGIDRNCIALPNGSRVEKILSLDEDVVVQDNNSQKVAEFFPDGNKLKVWDCCAASGGKSILAYDHIPSIQLTVSDIRESIISNLRKRFERAGIKKYQSFITDLSTTPVKFNHEFDLLICDAPCTGSGTWSRTPEQLYFFETNVITKYAALQKKIISNSIPALKNGGYFLYITCSVFRKENEETSEYIQKQYGLQLVKQSLLKGYDQKADTMFAALYRKGD